MHRRILDFLQHLSQQDLAAVKAFLSLGGSSENGNARQRNPDIDVVIGAICAVLSRKALDLTQPAILYKRLSDRQAFTDKCADLREFCAKSKLNTIQRQSLLQLGVELLVESMQEYNTVLITATTVAGQVHRIPAVIDANFPGYAESGLLAFIVRAK